MGFQLPGCFSERALLPEIALVKVDDRISDSEAACLQSLSDSVAAVETAQIQVGDSVAIFGQGSMGLECLQIARNCGAGLLITVDVREEAVPDFERTGRRRRAECIDVRSGGGDSRTHRRQWRGHRI